MTKPNDIGISVLIISSFVIILCVYVYQEYFKSEVREEFNDDNQSELVNDFVDILEKTDANWTTLNTDMDSLKTDMTKLKKMALNGSVDSVPPNLDELNAKVDNLTSELSKVKNRMNSLENNMESMQSVLDQMDGIKRDLLEIRNRIPDVQITSVPSWATKEDLDSLASEMNTRMDTRKATVDASLQNLDGYYDNVMSSVDDRLSEYGGRLERHVEEMDDRMKSMRTDRNAVLGQSVFNSEAELEKIRSDVKNNRDGIKDMEEHHHEQYALVGELQNNIEENVEKYLQNRTFNTNEFSHSNMRAQIEEIIREQQGNTTAMPSMSNYITRPEFQRSRNSQSQKDQSQDSLIGGLNNAYEMKNVVTYGELDERLDRYVTKMRFASLFDDDTIFPIKNPNDSNMPVVDKPGDITKMPVMDKPGDITTMPVMDKPGDITTMPVQDDKVFVPSPPVEFINDLMK
jgi:predicted  nucleic acid-binding Zn-ribbon protein